MSPFENEAIEFKLPGISSGPQKTNDDDKNALCFSHFMASKLSNRARHAIRRPKYDTQSRSNFDMKLLAVNMLMIPIYFASAKSSQRPKFWGKNAVR